MRQTALARCPGGGVLQRLYDRSEAEWRVVEYGVGEK